MSEMTARRILDRLPKGKQLTPIQAIGRLAEMPLSCFDSNQLILLQVLANYILKEETKTLPTTNPFKLGILFAGKKDVRPYLNYIYSDGSKLLASNGHIIIIIDHQAEKGFYNGAGLRVDLDWKYPEFRRDYIKESVEFWPVQIDDFETVIHEKSALCGFTACNNLNAVGKVFISNTYKNLLKKVGATEVTPFFTNNEPVGVAFYLPEMKAKGVILCVKIK